MTSNLPDKYANEPTTEVDHAKWQAYLRARDARQQWAVIETKLIKEIKGEMGTSFALTYDGEKIATFRPTVAYAEARLQNDYPDLTKHYVIDRTVPTFDMDLFAKAHPEIAEKYRVRTFREVSE